MLRPKAMRSRPWRALGGALFACAAGVCASTFAPGLARAHFILVTPDSWMSQSALGLPEKLGPCGDEGGGTPTGTVTAFRPGQTIAVTINEVIAHPGHYRVALSVNSRSELPPEPMVTPTASDPCASAAIQSPAVFPILADNVLPHTLAFTAPQTFMVTLPADVTCTKCTLQVLEFMSSHGAPCFYHHCADISIQGEPETVTPTPSPTAMETPTSTSTAAPTPTGAPTASTTCTLTQTATPSSTPAPTATAPPCVGDCDHNRVVTVDELLVGVRIVLGDLSPGFCPAFDTSSQGGVTVDALVAAVDNALSGCPVSQ